MSYIQGFVCAVPGRNRDAYIAMAAAAWPVFRDHGCIAHRETWGVDVPEGEVTSFPMAVKLRPGESVVFGWLEWPDRATCDAGMAAAMADPRLSGMAEMPFDGKRMIWAGFETIHDARA